MDSYPDDQEVSIYKHVLTLYKTLYDSEATIGFGYLDFSEALDDFSKSYS